ncbi:MAG: type II secretion system protein GspD [Chlamydiales bacterium]|nr:type II secretion system protein GspD [Chlamydiales bacterium]
MRFGNFYLTCACFIFIGLNSSFCAENNAPELDEEIEALAKRYLNEPTKVISGCPACPSGVCPTPYEPPETHYYFRLPGEAPHHPAPHQSAPQRPAPHPHGPDVRHLGGDNAREIHERAAEAKKHLNPDCPREDCHEGYTVNFEEISIIELIQFVSQISGTNYVFDRNDLNFTITIVSERPTTAEDLTAAMLQVFKMHGLSVVEQGNNVLIYKNQNVARVSTVITDANIDDACDSPVITRVFRLYNVDPHRIQTIIRPLLSPDAIIEVSVETRHLIVSDITANVEKIADLLVALDTPTAAFDIIEYRVRSAYPTALVAYAKEILAPLTLDNPMQIIAQPSANKIFVVSTPYLNQKALEVLRALDTADIADIAAIAPDLPPDAMANNHFYMYKLKYQPGRLIAEAMREIGENLQYAGVANLEFVNTIYSLQWIEVNNSIVVTGSQASINKVVELLNQLDQPPKQVYVEVLIIETTLRNSLDFGVQWIALGDEQDKLAFATGLLGNSPPNPNLQGGTTTNPGARYVAANPAERPPSIPNPGRDVPLPVPAQLSGFTALTDQTQAFGLGIVGNILRHGGRSFLTLGALVSALDQEAYTKVVLNPRIMVEDNEPANFTVGENIPYQTTSTVIQQTGSVTQNIQYEDIGVQLQVTPTIAPNNIVTLQINQSISELLTPGSLTPSTSKILATTRVHVPDGCFFVMSGHIRDQCSKVRSGIPCLGTLPMIGPIFSRNIDRRDKTNLIMFIRPKVVTTIDEQLQLTNQEGYQYNFETHPCAIYDCGCEVAPECQVYPPPPCPVH